jgi:hypothetical protein
MGLFGPYQCRRNDAKQDEWWFSNEDEDNKELWGPFATEEIAKEWMEKPELHKHKACQWSGYRFCSAMCMLDVQDSVLASISDCRLEDYARAANKRGQCANHYHCSRTLFV